MNLKIGGCLEWHLGKLRPAKKGSDQRYKQIYVTCLYDQSHERRLVGLVDGAVCLKANLDALPLEMVLLDFYHASEHVGDAATATGADKQWLEQTLHTLRHEGFDPFFQKLLDWRTPLRGTKRKHADALISCIAARKEMIRYDECDPRGLDVGSGPMESMCGVTTDRIKGRGRWDLDNAEAMMALEALHQSTGLWDKYWSNAFAHRN